MALRVLATALVLGLAPAVASGQAGSPLPGMMPQGALLPAELGRCCDGYRVGHWVEYLVSAPGRRQLWHLHLAVVGRDGDAYWIELTMAQPSRGEAIARMLVDPGEGAVGGRLRRLIIQPEGNLPLELPLDMAPATLPAARPAEGSGTFVGTETIRVTAGTFSARHYRRGEGAEASDVWISERVPLWGLARFQGPRAQLTLIAFGTGAASRVVGEPVPFNPHSFR